MEDSSTSEGSSHFTQTHMEKKANINAAIVPDFPWAPPE